MTGLLKRSCTNIYIYIYVFTKGLPSNDERSRLKWTTDRFAPPPLPLAKDQPALTLLQTLIFPARIHHEELNFWSTLPICVHRFYTDALNAYFDFQTAVFLEKIVSVFSVGSLMCMLIWVMNCFNMWQVWRLKLIPVLFMLLVWFIHILSNPNPSQGFEKMLRQHERDKLWIDAKNSSLRTWNSCRKSAFEWLLKPMFDHFKLQG